MNKLAKLKYLPNNFEVIEEGDYVICAISGKKMKTAQKNHDPSRIEHLGLRYNILDRVSTEEKNMRKSKILIEKSRTFFVDRRLSLAKKMTRRAYMPRMSMLARVKRRRGWANLHFLMNGHFY